MSALLKLAERCELASGPDQLLDRDIRRAIQIDAAPSNYTHSIDAAMTLVPVGFRLTSLAETIVDCPDPWRAILWERKRSTKKRPYGDGATAALALCAAALCARAA